MHSAPARRSARPYKVHWLEWADGDGASRTSQKSRHAKLACLALLFALALGSTQSLATRGDNNQTSLQLVKGLRRKPDSSSSMFADIEDLNDSSVRTKQPAGLLTGVGIAKPVELANRPPSGLEQALLPPPPPPKQPPDFDRLIERILQPLLGRDVFSPQQERLVDGFSGHGSPVAADANNKTTMRFFRNSKTFASIVYANAGSTRNQKRLINCHLVDLERHASDVALFEAKYSIRTIEIDFKDMMDLIESCTEVARVRRPSNSLTAAGASYSSSASRPGQLAGQLFAASLPNGKPVHQHGAGAGSGGGGSRPLLVVGRPAPVQGANQQPAPNSLAQFQTVMSGAMNKELERLPADVIMDDSAKLDLPSENLMSEPKFIPGGPPSSLTRAFAQAPQRLSRRTELSGQQPAKRHQSLINRLGLPDTNLRLVIGEVTPPPSAVERSSGGFKEALQEITSYDTTDLMSIWRGILPGTNWCGMGDRASSYNDLGFEAEIDICCRAHDFCPIRLSAFSSGYGLFNWSFYTRSHCACDQNFLNCLQQAVSPLASVVMRLYFSVMKTTCLHDNDTMAADHQRPAHKALGIHLSTVFGKNHHNHNLDSGAGNNQHQSGANSANNHLAAPTISGSSSSSSSGSSKGGAQLHQELQQRLLDQLRASLPIPALRQSAQLNSRIESGPARPSLSAASNGGRRQR